MPERGPNSSERIPYTQAPAAVAQFLQGLEKEEVLKDAALISYDQRPQNREHGMVSISFKPQEQARTKIRNGHFAS